MIEKLRRSVSTISFERVRAIAGGGNIVRPHVAQAMVEAGIVASEEEAFDEWIAGRSAGPRARSMRSRRSTPSDSSRAAGGLCVLAHPGMWGDPTSVPEELIEAMAAGGDGRARGRPHRSLARATDAVPRARRSARSDRDRGVGLPRDTVRPAADGDLALRAREFRRARGASPRPLIRALGLRPPERRRGGRSRPFATFCRWWAGLRAAARLHHVVHREGVRRLLLDLLGPVEVRSRSRRSWPRRCRSRP